MIKLNEYIGNLAKSIVDARVMSDLQSVRTAKYYEQDDYLKHFTIPRMKIEDIEMNIPFALSQAVPNKEVQFEKINKTKLNKMTYNRLIKSTGLSKLPQKESIETRKMISKELDVLSNSLKRADNIEAVNNFCRRVTDSYIKIIHKRAEIVDKIKGKESNIREGLIKTIKPNVRVSVEKSEIGDLDVIVEGHKLKELGNENLTYIKIRFSEQSLEKHTIEHEDKIEHKLLPE